MHEYSLAVALMETIDDIIKNQDKKIKKIKKIKLKIGYLRQVVPEILTLCFNEVSKNTVAEGANIEYEEIPLIIECKDCQKTYQGIKETTFICPYCKSTNTHVIKGEELEIDYLEVEIDE